MRASGQQMERCLRALLSDCDLRRIVTEDFAESLERIGIIRTDAIRITSHIVFALADDGISLQQTEHILQKWLADEAVRTAIGAVRSIKSIIGKGLSGRAALIFDQIAPHIADFRADTILDFGCGDGLVTERVIAATRGRVCGCDIRDYRANPGVFPFALIDAVNRSPYGDGEFDIVIATNVLHHDENNEVCIREMSRVTRGRLIVIETVPESASAVDFARTYANDYFYNRIMHDADVPVPGTYELADDWPARFATHGFELVVFKHLGYDQDAIRDYHVLYVFDRLG